MTQNVKEWNIRIFKTIHKKLLELSYRISLGLYSFVPMLVNFRWFFLILLYSFAQVLTIGIGKYFTQFTDQEFFQLLGPTLLLCFIFVGLIIERFSSTSPKFSTEKFKIFRKSVDKRGWVEGIWWQVVADGGFERPYSISAIYYDKTSACWVYEGCGLIYDDSKKFTIGATWHSEAIGLRGANWYFSGRPYVGKDNSLKEVVTIINLTSLAVGYVDEIEGEFFDRPMFSNTQSTNNSTKAQKFRAYKIKNGDLNVGNLAQRYPFPTTTNIQSRDKDGYYGLVYLNSTKRSHYLSQFNRHKIVNRLIELAEHQIKINPKSIETENSTFGEKNNVNSRYYPKRLNYNTRYRYGGRRCTRNGSCFQNRSRKSYHTDILRKRF